MSPCFERARVYSCPKLSPSSLEEFEKQDSGRLTAYTDRTRTLGKAKTDIGAEWSGGDAVAVEAVSLGVKRRLDQTRLEVTDPMHLLAVVVQEGIDVEVAEQEVSPVQARRARSLLLTQQKEDGS